MTRAQRELSRTAASEKARLDRLAAGPADAVTRDSAGLLARHYLEAALDASGPVDFSVLIKKAEDFAVQSGDKTLLAKIRSLEGRRR